MLKIDFSLKIISLCLCAFGLFAFGQDEKHYHHFVDSANVYIDSNSEKALTFLDSIPKPVEKFISGKLTEYYRIKALVHEDFKEYAKNHQCIILALKYAEEEKKFYEAAQSCIDLYANLYFLEKKGLANTYLNKAEAYFKQCDYKYGKVEIDQIKAYAKFLDGDREACNTFLLERLEAYKAIEDDKYYYLFALYMLTSNYIHSKDVETAYKYHNVYKTLENDTTIVKYNYLSFKASINTSFADAHFEKKNIDSTLYYLNKSSKLIKYMVYDALEDYYRLSADTYKYQGHLDKSKIYVDSLMYMQRKMYNNSIEASFDINDSLLQAESKLMAENKENTIISILSAFLIVMLLLVFVLFFVFYQSQKDKVETYSQETNNLSYLKSNNEQLAVKVHGLEGYIKNLKQEVKEISRTESIEGQKEKIKELYKNLYINSSTLLDKSENHLDLVNKLNIDFFTQIEERYPQLNKSEIIICYYLFMGFTNKEIAVFLNATVRSVESRRYRISKKIELVNKNTTLLKHLQVTFSDTL